VLRIIIDRAATKLAINSGVSPAAHQQLLASHLIFPQLGYELPPPPQLAKLDYTVRVWNHHLKCSVSVHISARSLPGSKVPAPDPNITSVQFTNQPIFSSRNLELLIKVAKFSQLRLTKMSRFHAHMHGVQFLIVASYWLIAATATAQSNVATINSTARSFLAQHCIKCHNASTHKGDVTLTGIGGSSLPQESALSQDTAELYERVLSVLESGEMPPAARPIPNKQAVNRIRKWLELQLQSSAEQRTGKHPITTTRRLTNFEYQNTMRDLLGFDLQLLEDLPKDPVTAYRFNNTSDMMRLGPEQVARYLATGRRAMEAAIVDPKKPEVHQWRTEWKPHGLDRGLGGDELGVWGNRRNTPATGMGLRSIPRTGEYRIRMQASAILPPGIKELPLRLVMGFTLNVNSATQQMEPVGTVRLSNTPDEPQIIEFRGRIENHPAQLGKLQNGVRQPSTMVITPQNLFDDGTLNDGNRNVAMPRAVINWMEFEAPITEVWPPVHHQRILFESPLQEQDPPAYIRSVLQQFISRAYRRPATKKDIASFERIYNLLLPELKTREAAIRETLAMVLISPQFLYHTNSAGNGEWKAYEFASKLSYFLWGSMPDDELLQLAASGKLLDKKVVGEQVLRMLSDSRSSDFVKNFTMQWLSLTKMKTVPINRTLFPRFLYYVSAGERAGTEVPYRPTIRDHMQQETIGFVQQLIQQNLPMTNLVDSDFAYLNQPLAAHYGIENVQGDQFRVVPIQAESRLGGLLTHGSVLLANGTGSAPHPVYRAVWLREAILGDEVSPPPADVPALSESAGESGENAVGIKELLEKHRQKESCNDCHARLDPWGIPFERYNATGQFQPNVPKAGTRVSGFYKHMHGDMNSYEAYLESINTESVDASAKLPSGETVRSLDDLKRHLLSNRKEEIAGNIVRRFLSYAIGRELDWQDRFEVKRMLNELQKDDFRLRDMIVLICQSETFRNDQ
jgi:mono/diheme cytochrome c family protein